VLLNAAREELPAALLKLGKSLVRCVMSHVLRDSGTFEAYGMLFL